MGNAESQPVRNVDKRTARRDNSAQFNAAIWKYRANVLGPLQTMGLAQEALAAEAPAEVRSRLRVCIRRRGSVLVCCWTRPSRLHLRSAG